MRGANKTWFVCAIGAGIVLITWVWLVQAVPQEPDLLQQAQLVATSRQWLSPADYAWVTSSQLLCQRTTLFDRAAYDRAGEFDPFWFDIQTKTVSYDPLLNLLKTYAPNGYSTMHLSPDSIYALGGLVTRRNGPRQPERSYYELIVMKGGSTTFHEAGSDSVATMWCPDSRHWLEFAGKTVAQSGKATNLNYHKQFTALTRVLIHSVNEAELTQTLDIAPDSPLRDPDLVGSGWHYPVALLRHLVVLSPSRFLIWTRPLTAPQHVTVQEIDLRNSKPIQNYVLTPPKNTSIIQLVPSPDGSRFVWKLYKRAYPNPLPALILSFIHQYDIGRSQVSLWVSQRDGSAMHEIGAAPSSRVPIANGGPSDPETGEHLRYPPVPRLIRWLPDGKHISFAYKNDLYTVSSK